MHYHVYLLTDSDPTNDAAFIYEEAASQQIRGEIRFVRDLIKAGTLPKPLRSGVRSYADTPLPGYGWLFPDGMEITVRCEQHDDGDCDDDPGFEPPNITVPGYGRMVL